jgi:positive regulator of sigma E activity
MKRREARSAIALYVVPLVVVVVAVDVLFFRHHFWERLIANVGIVLVFGVLYLFRRPSRGT